MHSESLAIVYLHNYNKKGTLRPSTLLINISKMNFRSSFSMFQNELWKSLDFHSSQEAITLIHLNRKLILEEHFRPNPKGNVLAKGNMFLCEVV